MATLVTLYLLGMTLTLVGFAALAAQSWRGGVEILDTHDQKYSFSELVRMVLLWPLLWITLAKQVRPS